RAADDQPLETGVGAQLPATELVPEKVSRGVGALSACGHQLVGEPGEVALEQAKAAGEDAVALAALRHPLAAVEQRRGVVEPIPLDDRHPLEMAGQHAR